MSGGVWVLHVDDDPSATDRTASFLEDDHDRFAVETATSADEGLEKIDSRPPDCVVSDYELPGMDGLQFLQAVREAYPDCPFILFTGEGSEKVASDAISAGVTDYLRKGSGTEQYEQLADRIRTAVQTPRDARRAVRRQTAAVAADRRPELEENCDLLSQMEQLADAGAWEYDAESETLVMTDGAYRLYGHDTDVNLTLEDALDSLHPDDRDMFVDRFDECLETGEPYEVDVRLVTAEGEQRLVTASGQRVTTQGSDDVVRGFLQDITERKRQERNLQEERTFIDQALDAIDDLFYVIDTDGKLVRWNENLAESLGYADEELRGRQALEFFPPDEHEAVAEAIETVLETGQATVEADVLRANGERVPYEFVGGRITDQDGEVSRLVGIGRDLTERKERERELQRERDLVTEIVETAPVGISVVTADGEVSFANERASTIAGWPYEEVKDTPFDDSRYDMVNEHGDPLESGEGAFERVMSQEEPVHDHIVGIRRPSGERVWLSVSGAPRFKENGELEEAVFVFEDITEKRELEAELSEILGRVSDGFYALDDEFRFTHVNSRAEELLEASEEELLGETVWEMYPEAAEVDPIRDAFHAAMDTQTSQELEAYYESLEFWVDASVYPSESGISVYFRDVTEQKERERELQRKTRAIEAATIGITITDPSESDNPLVYANDRFLSLTGYPREEILGRNCRFLQGERTRSENVQALRTGIDNQEPTSVELLNYRKDGTEFWNRVTVAPVHDDTGELVNYVGFQQDVTEEKRNRQRLENRERVLRELHTATREFYPPNDVSEIADFLVDFISGAFEFPYVSVKKFDEAEGRLEPATHSSIFAGQPASFGPVEPGPNPIWKAYEQNEPQRIAGDQYADILDGIDASIDDGLAFPTGEFGVIVVCTEDSETIEEADLELIEIVAANAESSFQRLHTAETHADVTAQLEAKADTVEELTDLTNTIQELHGSLAESESRDSLYETVCEKLTGIERIDFAWIGRPQVVEKALQPASWAGQESGYLNAIDPNSSDELLPAQRAASEHDPCSVQNIGSHARTDAWAKKALTAGFRSVVSVPLVYDDVLYGVLSAYSGEADAFDQDYTDLVKNAAALLVSYSATLESRYQASSEEYTILEFELADPTYPFHQLAGAADARIRFDSVVEITDTGMRMFVTVAEGDPETVIEAAESISSIAALTPMGNTRDRQISVTVKKPFLASILGKHGARLRDAVSDGESTTFSVEVPANTAKRPVLDALMSEYRDVSPVAQRQKTRPDVLDARQVEALLTERQYEILRAAFYGGYYEAPKKINGEDLATDFDISKTAVYNHLRAGHRKTLRAIFE